MASFQGPSKLCEAFRGSGSREFRVQVLGSLGFRFWGV